MIKKVILTLSIFFLTAGNVQGETVDEKPVNSPQHSEEEVAKSLFQGITTIISSEKKGREEAKRELEGSRFGLDLFVWPANRYGDIQAGSNGGAGSKIYLLSDLDMEKTSYIPGGRIWFRVGKKGRIRTSYFQSEGKETKVITEPFSYKNASFNTGESVTSNVGLVIGSLSYQYNFVQGKWLDLGALAGAQYFYLDSTLSSSAQGNQQVDIGGGLPMLGLISKIKLGKHLAWETQLAGAAARLEKTDTAVFDASSNITVYFNKHAGMGVGYRYLKIDTDGTLDSHLNYEGPLALFTLQF